MNKIEKLLRKIGKKDRRRLLEIINLLLAGKTAPLNIQKIKNSDFYKVRKGRFRIIFHYEQKTKDIVVDSIRLRNESTYKSL